MRYPGRWGNSKATGRDYAMIIGRDAITIRPMAYLSLTFDHRILDGALADAFLSKVVESAE